MTVVVPGVRMADGPTDGREALLEGNEVAALLSELGELVPDLRIAAYEALTRLPLASPIWTEIAAYCTWVLASSESELERLAVIDGAPWVPLPSIRHLLTRLATEGEGETGARAARAVVLIRQAEEEGSQTVESQLTPAWSHGDPAGFAKLSAAEMTEGRRLISGLRLAVDGADASDTSTAPFGRIREEAMEVADRLGLAPIAVTTLFERAARGGDLMLSNDIVSWVARIEGRFRPDLAGLFAVYRRLAAATWQAWRAGGRPAVVPAFFDPGIVRPDRYVCWQIAWTASRGGLRGLVPGLARSLTADDIEERLAAACLIADVAAYVIRPGAPIFGGGSGPERPSIPETVPETYGPPRPGRSLFDPPNRVDERSASPAPESPLDDDVQFTVYRPRVVQPRRWYPLVAFAHKSTPVFVDGDLVDPVHEVGRQSEEVLRGQAAEYGPVAVDSSEVLLRGTELLLEPWLEEARFDPERAWLRWQEPIHQALFRFRVPASADGRRLEGGLRVFLGVVLVGEVSFRVVVNSADPTPTGSSEPLAVKRYRQVFASYSHEDSELVRQVAAYLSVTGDRYFIDVQTLRSGERWESRLTELIGEADLFQLFWSRNAMRSEFVRREWEYALTLGREGFVRPVYWEDPLPEDLGRGLPPDALRRLHFARLPLGGVPPTARPPHSGAQALMVCRQCGFPNAAGEQFCNSCGTFLEWTAEKVPAVPTPPMPTTVPTPGRPPAPIGVPTADPPVLMSPQAPKRPTHKVDKQRNGWPDQRLGQVVRTVIQVLIVLAIVTSVIYLVMLR